MFNLTVLDTCLGLMNEAENGRIISTTRHYIHAFEATATRLTWKIEFAELTATSPVWKDSLERYYYKNKYDIITTNGSTNSTVADFLLKFTSPC